MLRTPRYIIETLRTEGAEGEYDGLQKYPWIVVVIRVAFVLACRLRQERGR